MVIVPDNYRGPLPSANWIYARYKTVFEGLYEQIEAGSTHIKISEDTGTRHGHATNKSFAGFENKVLKAIKRLMTTKTGRELIKQLAGGGQDVMIRPSDRHLAAAGADDLGKSTDGTGTGTTIYFDPNFSDETVKVFDSAGDELATPFFLALGHELIHARHNQLGTNQRGTPSADYGNAEEEQTIKATTGLTENALRHQHGLGVRHGHGMRVTADRTSTVEGAAAGG